MTSAFSAFTKLALRSQIRDDDGVDQLHHFVTVSVLVFFAAITGVVEYAGEPINCWNYGEYHWKHFQDHVNEYCWTHRLYYYPNTTDRNIVPYQLTERHGAPQDPGVLSETDQPGVIKYYRWVTIIFLVQAFCFKLPNLAWTEFNAYSGSNIVKMVEMLQNVVFAKSDDKEEKIRQVALFLEKWLRIHRKPRWFLKTKMSPLAKKTLSCCTLCIGNNIHNYLSTLYLLTKAAFLVNTVTQFLLLSSFLQINFWKFGTNVDSALDMSETRTFPLVALCHFQTYDDKIVAPDSLTGAVGATGKWVQCILRINVFLEKLFLIEWFWLLALQVITFISFIFWCFKILHTYMAMRFVRRYMKLMNKENRVGPESCSSVERFVAEYLRNDGVFVLRILAVNTNQIIVAELVEQLWMRYRRVEESVDRAVSLDLSEADTALNQDVNENPQTISFRKGSRSGSTRSWSGNDLTKFDAVVFDKGGDLPLESVVIE